MNETLYTIQVDINIIAENVRAEYVPLIVRGILSEYYADTRLEVRVIAQNSKEENHA